MIGDQADCLARIKGQLPPWFGNGSTPLLDGLLSGAAWALAGVYSLYAYAKLQTRILTATDGFLDMIAQDFFGPTLPRKGDDDDTYRRRIMAALFQTRATRGSVRDAVIAVTGNTPTITESAYAATVTVDPGPATSSQIAAAIDAVRPICCVITLVLSGAGSDFLATDTGELLATETGDTLST